MYLWVYLCIYGSIYREADLQDIAAIIADGKTDPTGGATPVSNETPPTANSTQVESTPPITKKTKKSRKKDL